MKRNYAVDDFRHGNVKELATQIAYHEAGHATSIYLYNKRQKLPPIFFEIHVKNHHDIEALALENKDFPPTNIAAQIEGGCLVENLALTLTLNDDEFSEDEKKEYRLALNADMINLLAGSIAEKNYIIKRDNEILRADMLNTNVWGREGNHSDMQKINHYLNFFSESPIEQQQKLSELVKQSFDFITEFSTWNAIKAVALYILESSSEHIHCEEIFKVVDKSLEKSSRIPHVFI